LTKKPKYHCHYHPDRGAFVDVGQSNEPFYICLECYQKNDRVQWDKDKIEKLEIKTFNERKNHVV